MNILLIGYGAVGRFYFNLLKKNKKIKNIFIFDTNKKIIDKKFYLDFNKKNLINENIKFAIIATPSHLHFKFAQLAIKNNLNLLIEKPLVLNIKNAKKLIKLSSDYQNKCWVVFQNRYNKAIQKLKEKISKQKTNKYFYIDAKMFWHRDFEYYNSNWHGKYASDGGVLTNQAIHLIDTLVYIFGKIKKFQSILSFNKKKLEAEDFAIVNFLHKNNLISSLTATTRANQNYECSIDVLSEQERFSVSGVSLNIFYNFKKEKKIMDKINSEDFSHKKGVFGAMGNGHKKILDEFLNKDKIKSSKNLEIRDNLHVLEILHSIYRFKNSKKLNKINSNQSILGKNEN